MQTLINIQKRLLPDLLEVMQKRYGILHYIRFMQPVGRRSLAHSLNLTERVVRSEVEYLKQQNLIEIHSSGMSLSADGLELLEKLDGVMREISGIDQIEKELQQKLGVEVVLVAGNSDVSPWVKSELGKAGALRMKKSLSGENIIAVTGGTTMATVADMLKPIPESNNILFVPARGGLGEEMKDQANTIVSKMAEKMNASYRVLYVPDQISDESYATIMKEPSIKEVTSLIKDADIIIHGIGEASVMAKRRNTTEVVMKKIKDGEAVGEAFGYYFNEHGQIVHKVQTVGIQLEDLDHAKEVIAVAGGTSKAKAIGAYMQSASRNTILITDEAAAIELLKG
ncbi:sugar-binding transcriptional regulator [Bacillus massiliigorillae]|uniref:sugar-binding transcriptional regulator n=1 Tax=Bacillus massiliigorillae TaxID=1243664 RepID=UPI0003A55CAF|nr:sugar-binding domain-containing protein [Bacillus massiliigorillae]